MRLNIRIVFLLTALLSASLACQAVTSLFVDETPEPYVTEEPYITEEPATQEPEPDPVIETEEASSCPQITDKILDAAAQFYGDDSEGEDSEEPEDIYLVTYTVTGDEITDPVYEVVPADLASYQEDVTSHEEIWGYYTTLIPPEERTSLAEYSIVTDGEDNLLAAVAQTTYDPALWGLEVDIRDTSDKLNLVFTLIHEYAHLLTLGPDQVTPSEAVFINPEDDAIYMEEASACPDYFPGEGCSQPDSYINAYFNGFWMDIYEEWQDINLIEEDDAYYEALDDFYYKYEDRFLTDYAVTNPEEDIAESFTFFVLSPRPNGDTIAEEKILFFYQYNELIQLREEILRGVCNLGL